MHSLTADLEVLPVNSLDQAALQVNGNDTLDGQLVAADAGGRPPPADLLVLAVVEVVEGGENIERGSLELCGDKCDPAREGWGAIELGSH